MTDDYARGLADGRALERELVLRWLRDKEKHAGIMVAKHDDDPSYWRTIKAMADAFERGEHDTEGRGGG